MRHSIAALLSLGALAVPASPTTAQTLGTFSWQLQPFCNVVTATVTQVGGAYRIEGTDSQCGPTAASVIGMAFPDGTGGVSFGLTIVGGPTGAPVHVRATIDLGSLSGPWSDSAGNSGTFAFGASTGGDPRPAPPAPAQFGATVVQPAGATDRAISARVDTDTGGILGDSAAVYGQFGTFSGWGSPGRAGVRGDANADTGVLGTTNTGRGVAGVAQAGTGVEGYAFDTSGLGRRGVLARTGDGGTALEISNGGIKVSGTVVPAFIHTATAGNISGNETVLNHPLANNDPNALVFVTQNWTPSAVYNPHEIGVYYSAGRWRIFNEDVAAMPVNAAFNVLVIKR